MVVDSLVLHLHPSKVPVTTLKWTYTWGLGGLSAVLLTMLIFTGIILLNNYTPAVPQAYLDILELRSNVWFGELIRNMFTTHSRVMFTRNRRTYVYQMKRAAWVI